MGSQRVYPPYTSGNARSFARPGKRRTPDGTAQPALPETFNVLSTGFPFSTCSQNGGIRHSFPSLALASPKREGHGKARHCRSSGSGPIWKAIARAFLLLRSLIVVDMDDLLRSCIQSGVDAYSVLVSCFVHRSKRRIVWIRSVAS